MNEHTIRYRPYGQQAYTSVIVHQTVPDRLQWNELGLGSQCLVVFDQNVEWFADRVVEMMSHEGFSVSPLALVIQTKDLESVTTICRAMVETLPSFVVAIGGGATCDMTAFASSCFRRGTPVILVPTTLLAVADACVSGKTGVDFGGLKNSLGTIYYPRLSFCVLDALRTLDRASFRSGLAEIVKVAITSSPELFTRLEDSGRQLSPTHPDLLDVVIASCKLKADIVEGNPMMRLHSIYGHVIGQAIESLTLGANRHGDCVAIGMGVEGHIAVQLGLWPFDSWKRQMQLLWSLGLPTQVPPAVTIDEIIAQMKKDKLATPNAIRMILPSSVGSVYAHDDDPRTEVSYDLVARCLREYIDTVGSQSTAEA